ncbi:MAG: recombination regulator RecX [Clostridiales bacterium]|nr:recombination regulator RecX [Clostridiales bacterium]
MEYRICIQRTSGKKLYVSTEYGEGIYLYPAEIKKQRLEEGTFLTEEEFEQLRKEYAIPRARKRALGILAKRDCTEKELRDKLQQSMNDAISIDRAVDYMKANRYVDDENYVRDYIYFKKEKKSYRQIRMELEKKGVADWILDRIFEEIGEQDAEDLRPLLMKYIRKFPEMDSLARKKTGAYFYRKGYSLELIRKILDEMEEE